MFNKNRSIKNTKSDVYADRLVDIQWQSWKLRMKYFNPYRYHFRRITQGYVLDIGCGIGRTMLFMPERCIGIDHNERAVTICRDQKLTVFLPEEFKKSKYANPETFDTLLLSHVLEHMTLDEGISLVSSYLPYLKKSGLLVLVTPQEIGYGSDPTHVEYVDFTKLGELASRLAIEEVKKYSFPFPRSIGKIFIYNEFIYIGKK